MARETAPAKSQEDREKSKRLGSLAALAPSSALMDTGVSESWRRLLKKARNQVFPDLG